MGRRLFVIAAALLLALPLLLAPFGADIRAYRTAAVTDVFSADPAGYVTDRLALRTAAITGRARLLSMIGESGSPQVIRGRNGFLFFRESLDAQPLTPEETTALTEKLLALDHVLAADGRRLLILIAPDKRSIYPELLPWSVLPEADSLAQLNADLSAAGLTVLDAQRLLMARKGDGLLYFAGDSHWNARGARLVYQALMDMTGTTDAPAYADVPLLPGTAGDLLLLCQPGTLPTEADAEPEVARVYRTVRPMRTVDDACIRTTSPTTDLHLLVIRDSFGRALFPYLANTAGSLTFSRSDADVAAQAASAQADWVVIEVVQRNVRDWLEPGALLPEK